MRRPLASFATGALAALTLAACAGPAVVATRADLEARAVARPNDPDALRDLGLALAIDGEYGPARGALLRAVTLRPADGQALYSLGLVNEALGVPAEAEAVYSRYAQIPDGDAYRDSLRGRYDAVVRRRLQTQFADALAADSVASVSGTDAVGVLPFAYVGPDPQYAALGRGMAEVLSVDLATVGGLTVVERVRLDALLAEYDLARRGQLDPATVPRAGGLLRVDRLVGGQVTVTGSALRVDAAVWSTAPDALADETAEGGLAEVFAVQRTVTRGVLEALGVTMSDGGSARLGAPTDDLQAFLLFSRGLLEEDDGHFLQASQLYAEALARDPSFLLAAQRRAAADLSSATARPAATALAALAAPAGAGGIDLVGRRADEIAEQLHGFLAPGSREAVVDGSRAGILGSLPDPPPPPSGGGQ